MKYRERLALILLAVLFAASCGSKSDSGEATADAGEELTVVTREQFSGEGMALGSVTTKTFEDVLRCNGYITAPPGGMAMISAPVEGFVESVKCNVGDFVKKGQTLALLSGRELILVQKEFAESAAQYHRLESDYKRSKALYNDRIGSEKDLLALESELSAAKAGYHSLKRRLELLRLDPAKAEAGEIFSSFPLISPIQGYITNLSLVIGQFAEPQSILAEVVDISRLQLKLNVFEKDVHQLNPGQRVRFRTLGSIDSLGEASLITVGQAIQPESRSISCIAEIKSGTGRSNINNLFTEADIIVSTREAPALPAEALIKSGKEHYVFVLEKSDEKSYSMKKVNVKIGMSSDGFTEILDGDKLGKVLVKGAYNLSAE